MHADKAINLQHAGRELRVFIDELGADWVVFEPAGLKGIWPGGLATCRLKHQYPTGR